MINERTDYWQAVLESDPTADGKFYYAVVSTGVYCKPSCPSRTPRRENVRFYQSAQAAEAEGYRPCKRCHPQGNAPEAKALALVKEVCEFLQSIDYAPSLGDLAERFHFSAYHLQRTFKRVTGVSPKHFAETLRQERLRGHLRNTASVTDAIYGAGYESVSSVYERGAAGLGMSPGKYRAVRLTEDVSYTVAACPLGAIGIASTTNGICRILLDDDEQAAEEKLIAEFPRARRNDTDLLSIAVGKIARFLAGEYESLDLPLDVRATAFQSKVWNALRSIPYGETRSYQEVAEQLGSPQAVRAVARACAANPTALVVPCHRVVRSTGELSGYRWGVKRKQTLLDMEGRRTD